MLCPRLYVRFLLAKLKSSLRKFYGRHNDLVDCYGTSVTNDHGCVSLVRSFPHSWLITRFVTRVTRRVPLVEQKMHTLPEHMSSPPVFQWESLVLYVVFCTSLFVLFYFFLLAIVLSILLWLTVSYYPFDIFKLLMSPLLSRRPSPYPSTRQGTGQLCWWSPVNCHQY